MMDVRHDRCRPTPASVLGATVQRDQPKGSSDKSPSKMTSTLSIVVRLINRKSQFSILMLAINRLRRHGREFPSRLTPYFTSTHLLLRTKCRQSQNKIPS